MNIIKSIREVLEESDMVKFAKYYPSPESAGTIIDRALVPVKTVLEDITRKKEQESQLLAQRVTPTYHSSEEVASVSEGGK
jgi:hypothetical protein